jgi:serine protease Do
MALKKHHKWLIGGFTSVVIIFMISVAIIINGVVVKQQINHNELSKEIQSLKNSQTETQAKLNGLTESLIETKQSVSNLDESFKNEINELKASVSEDFSGIIESSIEAVVTIRTDISQGTGFLIHEDGYIITNAHVLSGGSKVSAFTSEHEEIPATLIDYDTELDLALLKINGNYKILELGNSDDVSIGERVIAIGNPLGLQFSVSQGIVSAIHRPGPNELEIYIQTDTPLNPGNSGGPLINREGEAIGINNFKIGSGESLGFALESNYIKDFVNDVSLELLNQTLIQ